MSGAAGGHAAPGQFTTDLGLVVRSWNPWLAAATGVPEADAYGRSLDELFPEVAERGHLARLRRVADAGAVEVMAPAFHGYLIPCPPRTPSAHFTRMQQHVTIAPLRAGEAIVGVTVSIEDVTARRDREKELAAQLASGDESVRLHAARALAAEGGPADALADVLGDPSWRVRRAAAEGLARGEDDDAVAALLAAVRDRHRDPAVLNAALTALAHARQDVVPPLLDLLASGDAEVRTYVALAMGLLADRRAVPALVRALADADPNARFHAIEALGRIGAREAAAPLAAVAESRDFAVAFAALDALALIGEPSVSPSLVPLLEDELLQTAAADALGRLGGEEVAGPLAAQLDRPDAPLAELAGALATLHARLEVQGDAAERVAAVVRGTLTPSAGARLVRALEASGDAELGGLLAVAGWIDGDGVEAVLARMLTRRAGRRAAAELLARRGPAAVPPLLDALSADDPEARKAAAAALGRLGAADAVPALVGLLDAEAEVAVVAAGALGHIGDARAFEPLLAHLGHPQAAVRQAVVAALNSIGHPAMPGRVRALLESPSPRVREAAARAAGYFGYAECAEALLALGGDGDEGVRRAAVEQLAHLDDPRALPALVGALRTGSPGVRAAAARALAHVATAEAAPALLAACRDADHWVRYYAARSAHLGVAEAVPTLAALAAGDPLPPVRIAAAEALAEIGDADGLAALRPLADDPDGDVAGPALLALGSARDATSLPPLVGALGAADRGRRLAALEALGRRPDAGAAAAGAVPAVARLARSAEDADERALATETLGRIGGEAAVGALVALAEEPRRTAAVVAALAGLGEPQLPWVGAGLAHPDASVRCAVAEALGRSGHPAAARLLAGALRDESPAVRQAAAYALERLDLHDAGGAAPAGAAATDRAPAR